MTSIDNDQLKEAAQRRLARMEVARWRALDGPALAEEVESLRTRLALQARARAEAASRGLSVADYAIEPDVLLRTYEGLPDQAVRQRVVAALQSSP